MYYHYFLSLSLSSPPRIPAIATFFVSFALSLVQRRSSIASQARPVSFHSLSSSFLLIVFPPDSPFCESLLLNKREMDKHYHDFIVTVYFAAAVVFSLAFGQLNGQ